jgi:hypothetical protein
MQSCGRRRRSPAPLPPAWLTPGGTSNSIIGSTRIRWRHISALFALECWCVHSAPACPPVCLPARPPTRSHLRSHLAACLSACRNTPLISLSVPPGACPTGPMSPPCPPRPSPLMSSPTAHRRSRPHATHR